MEQTVWQVAKWRDNKVIWWGSFLSEAEALQAAGLTESMPQENIEGLRQGLDAFNRRDKAAFLELCDPAVENVPPRDWPESELIRGSEAVWDFYVQGFEPWELSPLRLVEMVDAGNDKVVTLVQGEMQGKASGAVVPWSYWLVVTARDGKTVRFEWFTDRAAALEAAGVSE
jgi:ketosteroid isomerase-like protein